MKGIPQASRSWISCFTCSLALSAQSAPACGGSAQPLGKEELFKWLKCLRCSLRQKAYKQASWVRGRWSPQPHLPRPRPPRPPDPLVKQRVGGVNLGLHWSHSAAPWRCSGKHQHREDSPLARWRGLTPRWRQTWPANFTVREAESEVEESVRGRKDYPLPMLEH